MAVGTLASRLTGFLRTVVIAAAMGLTVAESYNVANTIPNILYDLLLGGVLTSVVVPLLARGWLPAGRYAYAPTAGTRREHEQRQAP